MKAKEVLTQVKHPYKSLSRLKRRCLSLLWKHAMPILQSAEIRAITDILHPVRKWLSLLAVPRCRYKWIEFGIKRMFPNIHREEILPALCGLHQQVAERKTTRGTLRFFISKDGNRKLDNCSKSSKEFFHGFTFSNVVCYVLFDTFVSDCFLNLSSIVSKNTGIPIGGSCSPQLASLVLIHGRKTKPLRRWTMEPASPSCAALNGGVKAWPCDSPMKPVLWSVGSTEEMKEGGGQEGERTRE